jgi:hypothetical protein
MLGSILEPQSIRFRQPMTLNSRTLMKCLLPWMVLCGCLPKIGEKCITDIDCSQVGDRLCDTTQPNGYCTIADCGPTSCPEKESVCVSFNTARSNHGACANPSQPSPHRRNFCMALCEASRDCRSGYACIDLADENVWSAGVISKDPRGHKVCMVAESHPEIEPDRPDDFCRVSVGGAGGAGD